MFEKMHKRSRIGQIRHRRSRIRSLAPKEICGLGIPGQGGRDSGIDPVSIPKLIRSRFRDEAGQGFRF